MELLGDVMGFFIPGLSQVHKILGARVPIIRFVSEFTGLHCDLSMSSSSGVFMSELIYMMGCIDSRFQPLIVTVRSWAAARKITNLVPGNQPTNFIFVMLVINFLQHKKILPTWDVLFNNATKEDVRVTADGVDCTYLRDLEKLQKHFSPQNGQATLTELLHDFFEFYANFDFATRGVSLFTGSSSIKPNNAALFIQNPLERHMNVSKNVTINEVTRLKNELRSALWKLETVSNGRSANLVDILLAPQSSPPSKRITMTEIFKD
jgi:poly(A) RNA polymerase